MIVVETNSRSNKTTLPDPLDLLLRKYPFAPGKVRQIVSGSKYTAVECTNGTIGVCANRGFPVKTEPFLYEKTDLSQFSHRVVMNAFLNATLNQAGRFSSEADIYDAVNFKSFKNPVMLGFFKPLLEKFDRSEIQVSVFDPGISNNIETYLDSVKSGISKADALILTSTSVSNGSFLQSIGFITQECAVYLLGPSSVMSLEMRIYPGIKMIFGTTFDPGSSDVLEIIKHGGGTRDFQKFGKKQMLKLR